MYTANIISKYILFWTSFRSDSNTVVKAIQCKGKNCNNNTHTHTHKNVPGRVKGSLGTNHHDVEPKYMVSVIDMVQERETSVSVFLTQSS